jgi:hypothetical protein
MSQLSLGLLGTLDRLVVAESSLLAARCYPGEAGRIELKLSDVAVISLESSTMAGKT